MKLFSGNLDSTREYHPGCGHLRFDTVSSKPIAKGHLI